MLEPVRKKNYGKMIDSEFSLACFKGSLNNQKAEEWLEEARCSYDFISSSIPQPCRIPVFQVGHALSNGTFRN